MLDDPSVSRQHCRLARDLDGWTLEDLASANGTLLDGQAIDGVHPIPEGTEISLGIFRLTLVHPAALTPSNHPRERSTWTRRARPLATATIAIAIAITSGWTSARIWTSPLDLPATSIDCPKDHPALLQFESSLARTPTLAPEAATHLALESLAQLPDLSPACNLRSHAETALTAALARMDHQRLGQHPASIRSLIADATHVASLDRDGNLMQWTPGHRGRPLLAPPRDPESPPPDILSLAHDATTLIAGTADGRILRWDRSTLELTTITHSARPISAVAITATHLWSIDDTGLLRTHPIPTRPTPQPNVPHAPSSSQPAHASSTPQPSAPHAPTTTAWPGVHTLTPLHDGRVLAFGADRAAVFTADLRRATPLTTGAALRAIAVSDTDIITGDLAGKVTRFRLARTLRPEPLTGHGGPIRAVAVRADLVASIGEDDALRLVELGRRVRRGGPPLVLLAEVPVPVDRLMIRDTTLIGSGPAGALVTWDLSQRTRRLPATLHEAHPGQVTALTTTPTTTITGGDDGTLRAWPLDLDTTAPLLTRACTALGWNAPGCDP